MTSNDEFRQQLLELEYGLLTEEAASALRERIAQEPEVSALHAQAQNAALLFAAAARHHEQPIRLTAREAVTSDDAAHEFAMHRSVAKRADVFPGRTARIARWCVGLAAAALVSVMAGSYWYAEHRPSDLAMRHLRLLVTGPAKLDAGVESQYSVTTLAATGLPLPSEVQYAVYAADGRAVLQRAAHTDSQGHLQVTVPPELSPRSVARLEVVALYPHGVERLETPLPVDDRRFVTQLSLDKPLYQPGETVYYRSLTLGRFGLDVPRDMTVHFEVHDPSGAVVSGSEITGTTQRGVGSGSFTIPPELSGGKYQLVATNLEGAFPDEKRSFYIRQYRVPRLKKDLEFIRDSYTAGERVVANFSATRAEGGPVSGASLRLTASVDGQMIYQASPQTTSAGTCTIEFALPEKIEKGDGQLAVVVDDGASSETLAKSIPINVGKVDVNFYPEGGDLVAGLENKVYFTGRNPLGEPVYLEGQIVDSHGRVAGNLETTHKGMGSFSFIPLAGETYGLKISKPAGVTSQAKLPAAKADRQWIISASQPAFKAGEPIRLTILSKQEKVPLLVAAYCRGVQVGTQAVTTVQGTNAVSIAVVSEAAGVIRLTVYDHSQQPARATAERLVYRLGDRKLNIQVADSARRYAPGEPVKLSLLVSDEHGSPSPGVLGVAVVDDALLKLADDQAPSMPTHFLLTTEVEKPEDLEKADFYLSDETKAPAALDLLLGTQGWRRFLESALEKQQEGKPAKASGDNMTRLAALGGAIPPPAVFDNSSEVLRRYNSDLAAQTLKMREFFEWVGALALWGGLGLLLAILLLAALRWAGGVRFWLPGLAACTACLIVGAIWIGRHEQLGSKVALASYRPFHLEPAADQSAPFNGGGQTANADRYLRKKFFDFDGSGPDPGAAYLFAQPNGWAARGFRGDQLMLWGDAAGYEVAAEGFGLRNPPVGQRFGREIAQRGLDGELRARSGLRQLQVLHDRERMPLAIVAGRAQGLAAGLGAGGVIDASALLPLREYAHQHTPSEAGLRSDFAETLLWRPLLVADEKGRAEVSFDLSDSVTTYRLHADAHDGAGRIGTGNGEIISRIPFSLEPKLPLEVNAGDRIELPVAVNNDSPDELHVSLSLKASDLVHLTGPAERILQVHGSARAREYFTLEVTGQTGRAEIEVHGAAGKLSDSNKQTLNVAPPGFPVAQSYAGRLLGKQQVSVKLPPQWIGGSLEVRLSAFPSTLADLQKGVDSMLSEPNGCFEQASSTNYPNVLSLDYLQQHKAANPEVTRRAKELLKSGYAKLTGYECRERGFEWFGGDPGHEALTAYGLMEFRDMAKVHDVDSQMVQRTADWLLARRDGKGGFQRNARSLDSFGAASQDITDAYIVWALSESGQGGIDAEVRHVAEVASKSDDPYLLGLAGASAAIGNLPIAKELLSKLAKSQSADGHLEGKEGSITRSGGLSLSVETTALAALAWLKLPEFGVPAERAVEWITKNRQSGGGFGSTQATILALKALIAHAEANRRPVAAGELVVLRSGTEIGRQPFGPDHQNAITIEGIAAKLEPGENDLTVELTGDNQMPYALDISYRTALPASEAACPVRLSTRLAKHEVRAGDSVALEAELLNATDKGQPMTVAIVGLPAGLQARVDQLDKLKKSGVIDYYETRAREVIFYWRALAPSNKVELKLGLVAEWSGHYTAPASRAYLYYTAEQKQWVEPLSIDISR